MSTDDGVLPAELYRGTVLSSGVKHSPDETMEELCRTAELLRNQYHFQGYIHMKAIPGASPELVERLGHLVDRMSVNLELPTAEGLRKLAPNKSRRMILRPMKQIQLRREANKEELTLYRKAPKFVPAGQSTQMIVGATGETDLQIVSVTETLYQQFDLKRVFYSAFVDVNHNSLVPAAISGPPLLREHRLYQADWLLRFYGFQASELLSEKHPNFNLLLDPKCDWAVTHLEQFPVEINRADYYTLLRVPGIGERSARRIVGARRTRALDFPDLKKIGVVLKRALYFITCNGRMMYRTKMDTDYIVRNLLEADRHQNRTSGPQYEQLSIFNYMQG